MNHTRPSQGSRHGIDRHEGAVDLESRRSAPHVAQRLAAVLVMPTAIAVGMVGAAFTSTAFASTPTVGTMNNAGGVYYRSDANWNTPVQTSGFGVYPGTVVQEVCFKIGVANVPGSSNAAWTWVNHVSGPGYGSGYVSEHMLNDGAPINQAPSGVPACNAPAPPPPPAQSGNASLPVWFGSPVNGSYPTDPSSQPQNHKISYGGDWSMDIPAAAGQAVQVYVAPQDGQSSVTTKVEAIGPACASGVIAYGGYAVRVGVYNGTARIGYIEYAHVNPAVSVGQIINRWGGSVGTVGSYTRNSCWDGSHSHIEGYNTHNWSCFNGTYRPGQAISKSNFVGRLGGAYASTLRQACP